MRVVSSKLRESARMQECTVRIPAVCNWNPETTVLAHLPCGQKGTGMKSPDQMAVFACSHCHAFIDSQRFSELTAKHILTALAETQMYWIQKGLMAIKGAKP
jgi:hypothetical protein